LVLVVAVVAGVLMTAALASCVTARPQLTSTGAAAAAGGLSVFVGYAEDKEINTPDPASFPTPWVGAPNTVFLGGTVPGQTACGTLATCYDAGAIRLDNTGSTAVTVNSVSVDEHSSVPGGKVFSNLWGSFTVPAGKSVILTENPPANNPGFDNFDTSGFPNNNCTPVTVAPTVTLTVGGVATTLVDSTHVLDTGGIDAGFCAPQRNESIQWRPIGATGANTATLTLGPGTATRFAGQQVTETATLLDGSGTGLPNVNVAFTVTSGPDTGRSGNGVTDANGRASFTYAGTQGEDVVGASVTTVGTFRSNPVRVMWTNDSSAGWSSADVGNATPPGTQTLDTTSGAWVIQGGGSDINGPADQFHFLWQAPPAGAGVTARVASQSNTNTSAKAGVMVRAGIDPGAPNYAAFVTPGGGVIVQDRASPGGATVPVATQPGAAPAYLWVANSGNVFTAYTSNDGYSWQAIAGSTVTLNLGAAPLAGLAVTSHDTAQLATASMDSVAVTTAPPAPQPPVPCPEPWTCADIGNPTPAGNQSFDPNTATWTINAGGADITGPSDQFRFVWQTLTGDGSSSTRVASQTNTNSNAKAGVMLRASTDPSAPNYAVLVSPGAGIKVQARTTQGGTTTKLANPTGTTPTYLKVARAGNTFTAYTSSDGITWTLIAGSTATITLAPTLLEGLAATSHNTGALSTVTMNTGPVGVNPPANDFSIGATPSAVTVTAGQNATSTISTTVTSGAAQNVALSASGLPNGATASFNLGTISAGQSSTLTINTSTATPTGTSTITVTGTGATATHTTPVTLTVNAPGTASCPGPWTCADIGNPTPAGNQSFDPNTATWTINAGGADITGPSDQFRFVWQALSGDGAISARVASQTNTSSNAKAGVMLRAGTDPGAPNYAVLVSPGAGIKVQVRTTQGGTTTKLANPTGTTPAYLKVARAGNTFTAYTSSDSVTWTLIAGSTVTINLGPTLLEGLAATSHNTGTLGTITMDTVATS
jgi:outer membrane lipoprotein-sorting protein